MKTEEWLCALLLTFIFIAVFAAGCIVNPQKESPNQESSPLAITNPGEYFPMTGKWSYRVDLKETAPLLYWSTATSILRVPLLTEREFQILKKSGPYRLIIKVQNYDELDSGSKQSELKIIEDELGVLMDPAVLTWTMTKDQGTTTVAQRAYYEKGISSRPIFYLTPYEDLGQTRLFNPGSMAKTEDVLMYEGLDNSMPECEAQGCMKFARKIIKGSGAYGYTDNGFIEESYFAKGKGLVYLIQTVELPGGDNKVSMTWTLEYYTAS
jgi:hypothetical protein